MDEPGALDGDMIPPPRAGGASWMDMMTSLETPRRFGTAEAGVSAISHLETGHGPAHRRGQHKVGG